VLFTRGPYGRHQRNLTWVFLEEPIITLGLRACPTVLQPIAIFARFQYNKTLPLNNHSLVLTEKPHQLLEIAAFDLEGSTDRG
jgi:hypothetical protein